MNESAHQVVIAGRGGGVTEWTESEWRSQNGRMRDIRRRMTKRKAANCRRRRGRKGENVLENIEQRLLVNTHTSMRNIHTHRQTDAQQPSRCKADTRQAQGEMIVECVENWVEGRDGGRRERKDRGWQKRRGAGC